MGEAENREIERKLGEALSSELIANREAAWSVMRLRLEVRAQRACDALNRLVMELHAGATDSIDTTMQLRQVRAALDAMEERIWRDLD